MSFQVVYPLNICLSCLSVCLSVCLSCLSLSPSADPFASADCLSTLLFCLDDYLSALSNIWLSLWLTIWVTDRQTYPKLSRLTFNLNLSWAVRSYISIFIHLRRRRYQQLLNLNHCIMQFQGFDWLIAAMVYEPLYHARETATIKLSSNCSCKAKSATSSNIPWFFFFNKTINPLALVGYEMISNARSWNEAT